MLVVICDVLFKGMMCKFVLVVDVCNGMVILFDIKYWVSEEVGEGVDFIFIMDECDCKEIIYYLCQGKQSVDFVIVFMYMYELGNFCDMLLDFMLLLVCQVIDNGVDVFIGYGFYQLCGIEIYKGKLIYYLLGNFFFMENQQQFIICDEYEKDKVELMFMIEVEFMEYWWVYGVFKEQVWYESVVVVNCYGSCG